MEPKPGEKTYTLEDARTAQKILRDKAGLPEEQFPIRAFVGMLCDEIEALRGQGVTDEEMSQLLEANSSIHISGEEIAYNYEPPEDRRR
jgi:hypothetical protein